MTIVIVKWSGAIHRGIVKQERWASWRENRQNVRPACHWWQFLASGTSIKIMLSHVPHTNNQVTFGYLEKKKRTMMKRDEHQAQEEASCVHPLDFLHFPHDGAPRHDHQVAAVDEELEFCSDQVDWNTNSHAIDWNSPTPEHTEPAFGACDLHFDEIAARPQEQVLHKTSAYDTRSVVPTHASYAVPATFQPATMVQHKVHTSSIVPTTDGEKSHGAHSKNNVNVLSQKKSRRNMIVCLSAVSLVFIPLLIVVSLGVFNNDSSTPGPPIDNTTNVVGGDNGSSEADDDVVSFTG